MEHRIANQLSIALSIVLLGNISFQLFAEAVEPAKKNNSARVEHEWIVCQNHKDLGRTKIYFSKNAIKIFSESWGYSILSKAPDWSVVTYRDDDKIEWKTTRKQFYRTYPVDLKGMPTNHIGLKKSRAADATGAKSSAYQMGSQTFWFIEHLNTAPEVDATISGYYGIRAQKGILTKYALVFDQPKTKDDSWFGGYQQSGYVEYLTTQSFKELPYNPKDFAAPVGYKTAKDPYTISTSKAQKANGDSAMMELGIGEKLGR